jgi:hypothetical protein
VLLALLLRPTVQHGWPFGVGPDFPVYLWWTRVAIAKGISLVGSRPGTPALLAVLRGTLHMQLVPVVAGTQYALAPAMALAAIALVRGRTAGGRWAWVLVGSLSGLFAVHLAGGYLSNLIFAVTFVAAGAALAARSIRGTVTAAVLLGGGGLAHPEFFALGAMILAAAGAWAFVQNGEHGRSDARRVAGALVGGAIVGAGLLSMLIGPSRLSVDTSKDAFLRRAGLHQMLEKTYRDRFREKAHLYAPITLLVLAYPGYTRLSGFARRFLLAWGIISLAAVPVGLVTGLFPPERILTFGFAFPILAALGVVWVWERLEARRWLALAAAAALVATMAFIWVGAWSQQQTFMSPEEVTNLNTAARIAATLPPGTPLIFVVNDVDLTAIFLATHAENVIRATLPPDRVRDAYVYVGDSANLRAGVPTVRGHIQYDTLSRVMMQQIPPGPVAIFVVKDLNRVPEALTDPSLFRWSAGVTSSVPDPRPLAALPDELASSSPKTIAIGSIAVFVLMLLVGLGWSLWAFGETTGAVTMAPAFGAAILAIVGLAAELIGVPISGSWGPTLISAVAGGSGYLLLVFRPLSPRFVLERHPQEDPSAEVEKGPGDHGREPQGQEPAGNP